MDYHIILLPRFDYWAWVHACKAYILAFGPNVTADPETAARYMAPRQVVTFPSFAGVFPEHGDPVKWFERGYPGVRLDPIEVDTPDGLAAELQKRVDTQDRYGQRLKPFYLLWPTDYPVITQKFGANPQIYGLYGLPGHEGLDIRALTNTNVYACADGEVYEVYTKPKGHPYGIHIRIRHPNGYRTVYGHLAQALVGVGDLIKARQIIGKADSTGNSRGSHLHLSLKRDGATERGETRYPKDLIDPTGYMVWPDAAQRKSVGEERLSETRCLLGVHGRVGEPMQAADLEALSRARPEAIKIELRETRETIEKLREDNPRILIVARAGADFSQDGISPEGFVRRVESDLGRLYRLGLRYFELHTKPNLQIEGWRRSWRSGAEFSDWFSAAVEPLKVMFPEARFGFPGIAPGDHVSGQRADSWEFFLECEPAMALADWIGVNAQWMNEAGMLNVDGGRTYEEYLVRFPEKELMICEFCNPSHSVGSAEKGRQYLDYYRSLENCPSIVAAFCYALSSPKGLESMVWRKEDGTMTEIPDIIGGRTPTPPGV
jgi:murein DD-endopeptidase MepM/ murein hydrolase activator NlpD